MGLLLLVFKYSYNSQIIGDKNSYNSQIIGDKNDTQSFSKALSNGSSLSRDIIDSALEFGAWNSGGHVVLKLKISVHLGIVKKKFCIFFFLSQFFLVVVANNLAFSFFEIN